MPAAASTCSRISCGDVAEAGWRVGYSLDLDGHRFSSSLVRAEGMRKDNDIRVRQLQIHAVDEFIRRL